MKSQSISLRGTTHAAVKALAARKGTTASPLIQEWLSEYAPFGDKLPAPRTQDEPTVLEPAVLEPTGPQPHLLEPLDPPQREPIKDKPFVTHEKDPNLKPPKPRDIDGGGVVSF
jgi:hypothetical protein